MIELMYSLIKSVATDVIVIVGRSSECCRLFQDKSVQIGVAYWQHKYETRL